MPPRPSNKKGALCSPQSTVADCARGIISNFFVYSPGLEAQGPQGCVKRMGKPKLAFRLCAHRHFPDHEAQLPLFFGPFPAPPAAERVPADADQLRARLFGAEKRRDFFALAFEAGGVVPPQKVLYFCLRFPTFALDEGAVVGPTQLHVDHGADFYVVQTVHPFGAFFFQVLRVLRDAVTKDQLAALEREGVAAMSATALRKAEGRLLTAALEAVGAISLSDSQDHLRAETSQIRVEQRLLPALALPLGEAEPGARSLLRRLRFEEFAFVLLALMNEKTVVFVSESAFLIGAAIAVFSAALLPFKWPFPAVHCLPEHLLECLAAPVPGIYGLRCAAGAFAAGLWPRFGAERDNVWVLVDHGLVLAADALAAAVLVPRRRELFGRAQTIYQQQFNAQISNDVRVASRSAQGRSLSAFRLCLGSEEKLRRAAGAPPLPVPLGPEVSSDTAFCALFACVRTLWGELILSRVPVDAGLALRLPRLAAALTPAELLTDSDTECELLRRFFATQIFVFYVQHVRCAAPPAALPKPGA